MFVTYLALTDFRSYAAVELELEPGVTAFVGPNGQGKTNLVEAIGYAATLSSHRVSGDQALVRAGAERAVVRVRAQRGDRKAALELEITPGRANKARLNGAPVARVRDVLGLVRTVLFAPEDLALVKGDPDGRRRFLDQLTIMVRPRMAGTLADYDRVLKQRSALLKSASAAMKTTRGGADLRTLDVWDAKLADLGSQILAARLELTAALAPHVAVAYEQVSAGQGAAGVRLASSLDKVSDDDEQRDPATPAAAEAPTPALLEARLLDAMSRLRPKEIERGVCLVGPHRDDLLLELGGLPAKGYASHGESWSFALALRLACYRLMTSGESGWDDHHDAEPILVLDDVFAELDTGRRERLAQLIAPAGQVLITAAVPTDVPEELAGARVDVMGGEVRRVR
ncbi:MAG: DNA replication/repair protein RecF [Actinomycetales bacterium]|nr:DNA replication/repair protein RecF [Actinomycetales bacterium]